MRLHVYDYCFDFQTDNLPGMLIGDILATLHSCSPQMI